MDEQFRKFKRVTTKVLKKALNPSFWVLLIAIIVIIFLASSVYNVKLNDGVYKESDWSNTPYAGQQHTDNVSIQGNGNISTSMTAQELWDKMIQNGSRVDEYLDSPKELLKLLNAQMITEYLDTRPDPDEPIDWDKINEDVNSKEIQGIIKLKRSNADGTVSTMVYTDPETFQQNIDKYNSTGSEEDMKNALSYFTLERLNSSSSLGIGQYIEPGTTIIIPEGLGSLHTYMGWQMITSTSSMQYMLREKAGMNFDQEGFGRINGRYVIACTSTFGKVGDYIDFYQEDGSIIPCIIGDIKNQSDAGCNEWGHNNGKCIVEFVVNKDTWYMPTHANPGTQGCHEEWNKNLTKCVNGGSYFDIPNFQDLTITASGQIIEGATGIAVNTMSWPTNGAYITSYFGLREEPIPGASTNHAGIDIGVTIGTNVYAAEAGTVTTASYSNSAGNWIVLDHGNGYITKYMHNSEIKVSVGDVVAKGQIIALSGNSGNSEGPHLHFEVNYNGQAVDPLSFKYDNGIGEGNAGIGSNSSLSAATTMIAKVATWKEITDTVESGDPDVSSYSETTYEMTVKEINYKEFVKGYKMPFNYLWALLVIGQEKEFVLQLADLVYNSEIEITVHDNLTINTNVTTDRYTRKLKVITKDVRVSVTTMTLPEPGSNNLLPTTKMYSEQGGPFEREISKPCTVVHTIITKENTLDISLTKANVWLLEYTRDYSYENPDPENNKGQPESKPNIDYPTFPDKVDSIDYAGLAETFRNQVQAKYTSLTTKAYATITSLITEYYNATVDRTTTIDDTTERKKYASSPAITREKVEITEDEENFVTIFLSADNFKARNNILSASEWLYEILEKNSDTIDMVDLTKYLINKSSSNNSQAPDNGLEDFDFDVFNPDEFNTIENN